MKKGFSDEIAKRLADGDIESTMIVMLTMDGERIYLHHFGDDIAALDYLEQMTSSYRTDMIEKAIKRGMN
jgi:hypothetical protein